MCKWRQFSERLLRLQLRAAGVDVDLIFTIRIDTLPEALYPVMYAVKVFLVFHVRSVGFSGNLENHLMPNLVNTYTRSIS